MSYRKRHFKMRDSIQSELGPGPVRRLRLRKSNVVVVYRDGNGGTKSWAC